MDPIEWHSKKADRFEDRYRTDYSFMERVNVWRRLIEEYSDPAGTFLDVGCGSGIFSALAAVTNSEGLGIDPSPEMIRLCEARRTREAIANVRFAMGRLEDLPQDRKLQDIHPSRLVLCSSVLEYVDDLDAALATIAAKVTPNGWCIASMPNAQGLLRRVEPLAFKAFGRPRYFRFVRNVVSLDDFAKRAATVGLRLETHKYFAGLWGFAGRGPAGAWQRWSTNLFVAVFRREDVARDLSDMSVYPRRPALTTGFSRSFSIDDNPGECGG